MRLTNLEHPSFKEVKISLLQEILGLRIAYTDSKPILNFLMLLVAIENYHLYAKPITSNNSNRSHNINSLFSNNDMGNNASHSVSTSSPPINGNENNDIDDYVRNAFRSFNKNRNNNTNHNNN